MKAAVNRTKEHRLGRPQPRLRPRRGARRLTLGETDHQHGEVAGQIGDLDGAVERGEMQVQVGILSQVEERPSAGAVKAG